MSEQQQPQAAPAAVETAGEVAAAGAPGGQVQVEFGKSLPGQPPMGFPNGGDVDMYGNPRTVASEDPAQRTGDINENPPGDPPTPEQLAQMRQFLEQHGG